MPDTSSILDDVIGGLFGTDYLRDFSHASKIFRTNSYANAPKLKFLFHVYFDIGATARDFLGNNTPNIGLAVKTVKLPGFSFDVHTMNQYNRKRIVQTKIKYDDIEIELHDDNDNMVRTMWEGYYRYNYQDGTNVQVGTKTRSSGHINEQYASRTPYKPSIAGATNWGYKGNEYNDLTKKAPFFNNISVFGFNQHKWSLYTLINPVITRFSHDTYSYSEASGTMANTMNIAYETVSYASGTMSTTNPGEYVLNFANQGEYDTNTSPLMRPGGVNTIFGNGGLVDAGSSIADILGKDNLTLTDLLAAGRTLGTAATTFRNTNLAATLQTEVLTQLNNQLTGTPNRSNLFNFPINSGARVVLTTTVRSAGGST